MDDTIDIKAIRKGLNWTQGDMAEYLGLDRSSVSRMEKGQPPKGSTRRLLQRLRDDPQSADPGLSPAEVAA